MYPKRGPARKSGRAFQSLGPGGLRGGGEDLDGIGWIALIRKGKLFKGLSRSPDLPELKDSCQRYIWNFEIRGG